jgi:TolA-binding protein
MAVRLEHKEGQCEQLQEENNQLRRVQCEQQQRIAQQAEQIADLEHRLHQMCSPVKV